jgi:hypothetical protein
MFAELLPTHGLVDAGIKKPSRHLSRRGLSFYLKSKSLGQKRALEAHLSGQEPLMAGKWLNFASGCDPLVEVPMGDG